MTFKIINPFCSEGLHNKILEISALSKYKTRNMKNLHEQKVKLEHTRRSFLYTDPNARNGIPKPIRDAEIIARFKKELNSHLFS